jgi:hypothetical protein
MSNGETRWEVTVPANARAELPLNAAASWMLDGKPIATSARLHATPGGNGETVYELGAGTYSFVARQSSMASAGQDIGRAALQGR